MRKSWCCLLLAVSLTSLSSQGCSGSGSADDSEASETSSERVGTRSKRRMVQDDEETSLYTSRERALEPDEPHPRVVIATSKGDITLQLDAEKAPRTVENFLGYVEAGHYNRTIFHQVETGYVVLAGSYTDDLEERRGRYPIRNEAKNGLKNKRGTIAMARQPDKADSATCQFFINLSDNSELDHRGESAEDFGYCVFGKVVEGMDVLDDIAKVEVQESGTFGKIPVETVWLETAKRVH